MKRKCEISGNGKGIKREEMIREEEEMEKGKKTGRQETEELGWSCVSCVRNKQD